MTSEPWIPKSSSILPSDPGIAQGPIWVRWIAIFYMFIWLLVNGLFFFINGILGSDSAFHDWSFALSGSDAVSSKSKGMAQVQIFEIYMYFRFDIPIVKNDRFFRFETK